MRGKKSPRSGWDKRSMVPKNENSKEVPFLGTVFGPYVGYKLFEYDGRVSPKVVSCYKDFFQWWPVRTRDKAVCEYDDLHEAPEDNHTCGYYLFYDLGEAMHYAHLFKTAKPVVCEFVCLVAAWGKVIHHESGLRSSHMEILSIHNGPYDFKGELEGVSRAMGVPYLRTQELRALAEESGVVL